jgi:membrane peptidoglycan carboxypeptidase
VLTSEDGSFFHHRGFNQKAIRESLITNIKRGRFVRGGSTISMQLVKNVFLTRNKTIARKLEELLIVWIIEQNRLVSKDRMFEIYLNIIEWGPGVFGIGQASKFYFGKNPSELNLQESIFLAGIIPFPKRYKSVFEYNGYLKNYFAAYMERMKTIMVSRNYIGVNDTIGVGRNVFLSGPALNAFIETETFNADTLIPDEFIEIPWGESKTDVIK